MQSLEPWPSRLQLQPPVCLFVYNLSPAKHTLYMHYCFLAESTSIAHMQFVVIKLKDQ